MTGVNVDLENGVVTVEGTPDERAVAVAIEDCGFGCRRTLHRVGMTGLGQR